MSLSTKPWMRFGLADYRTPAQRAAQSASTATPPR